MAQNMNLSLSVVGEDLELMKEMIDLWELDKPTSPMDELNAFYSNLSGDINPRLCDTCKALEIDDSSYGGRIRSCERTEGCQHLFFLDLPREMTSDGRYKFMSLPVPFVRKDDLPSLPSLTASAAEGCQFCSLLMSILQNRGLTENCSIGSTMSITNAQYEWHTDPDSVAEEMHELSLSDGSLHLFSLRVQVDSNQPFKLWFRISAPPISTAVWLGIQRQPPLEFPSPDDGDGRFTFKSWLDEHIKACKKCQQSARTQHPTRLIDVSPSSDQEDQNHVQLMITSQHRDIFNPPGHEPPKYLALSYCWGENPPKSHTTRTENLNQCGRFIPLEELPAACYDAVLVTRTLGFRYLWIDALCIVQNDIKDWQKESRSLADIYSNAFLTIIPLSSQSSDQGFLSARSKSARINFHSNLKEQARGAFWMHEVPVDTKDYDPIDLQRRIQLSRLSPGHRSADEELKNSAWVTRGWTFNEALMSPRKLKFGVKSVEFECYGLQFVERALRKCQPVANLLKNHLWLQSMDKRKNVRDIIGRYWTASQYHISRRHFTKPKDRLPAISSFAELVHKKTKDEYIAGLFRSDLHRGLMWNKNVEDKSKGFNDHLRMSFFNPGHDYVAPSWSWVSTQFASYSWYSWAVSTITESECDIQAEVQPESQENPFGSIMSGHIVLTSKAYHSDSMQLYMREEKLTLKDNAGFTAEVDLDWTLQLDPSETLQISDAPRDKHHPLWETQGPLNSMHLVPLIKNVSSDNTEYETYGLVVIPSPNSSDGSWMRAGIFKSDKTWIITKSYPQKTIKII